MNGFDKNVVSDMHNKVQAKVVSVGDEERMEGGQGGLREDPAKTSEREGMCYQMVTCYSARWDGSQLFTLTLAHFVLPRGPPGLSIALM